MYNQSPRATERLPWEGEAPGSYRYSVHILSTQGTALGSAMGLVPSSLLSDTRG